jgi:hypothetical protein
LSVTGCKGSDDQCQAQKHFELLIVLLDMKKPIHDFCVSKKLTLCKKTKSLRPKMQGILGICIHAKPDAI